MKNAVINIKTDSKVKKEAQKVASDLGFSLSSLINGYLRQLINTKSVNFSLVDEEPSDILVRAIKDAEAERDRGGHFSFSSADEALNFVDGVIGANKKS